MQTFILDFLFFKVFNAIDLSGFDLLWGWVADSIVHLYSRVRMRTEREERQTQGDLWKSQRACEQLDSQKVRPIKTRSWGMNLSLKILAWMELRLLWISDSWLTRLLLRFLFQGITAPRDSWYWPEVVKDEEEELLEEEETKPEGSDEEEEEEELTVSCTSNLCLWHFHC